MHSKQSEIVVVIIGVAEAARTSHRDSAKEHGSHGEAVIPGDGLLLAPHCQSNETGLQREQVTSACPSVKHLNSTQSVIRQKARFE